MSRLLVARVVFIVAAVAVLALHVVVVIVIVIEEVGAFVGGRGARADAILGQCGGHLHAVALSFRLGGQYLLPKKGRNFRIFMMTIGKVALQTVVYSCEKSFPK